MDVDDDQKRGQHDGTLLRQHAGRIQGGEQCDAASRRTIGASVSDVDELRAKHGVGGEQLRLADNVAHCFHVHGMDGEDRRGDPCRR